MPYSTPRSGVTPRIAQGQNGGKMVMDCKIHIFLLLKVSMSDNMCIFATRKRCIINETNIIRNRKIE